MTDDCNECSHGYTGNEDVVNEASANYIGTVGSNSTPYRSEQTPGWVWIVVVLGFLVELAFVAAGLIK